MIDLSTSLTGRAGMRPMIGLALLSYCLLVMFPGEPVVRTQAAAAAPTMQDAASSAPGESKHVAQRT